MVTENPRGHQGPSFSLRVPTDWVRSAAQETEDKNLPTLILDVENKVINFNGREAKVSRASSSWSILIRLKDTAAAVIPRSFAAGMIKYAE